MCSPFLSSALVNDALVSRKYGMNLRTDLQSRFAEGAGVPQRGEAPLRSGCIASGGQGRDMGILI